MCNRLDAVRKCWFACFQKTKCMRAGIVSFRCEHIFLGAMVGYIF